MLAAVWWGRAARGEIRFAVLVMGWIGTGLFAEAAHTIGARLTREDIYFDEQKEMTSWLAKNAAPETVLAGFGVGGPIAAYGRCGIVLHPKFETKEAREDVKEYAEQLFGGTIRSFRDWAGKKDAAYFVYGMGSFATNEPTLQLRYMVNAMNPPPTSPARFFEAGREDGWYFTQVFANKKYRVYKILTTANEMAGNVAMRRAADAFQKGDLELAERNAVDALKANPNLKGADEILKHVVSLRGKGFAPAHESGR